MAVHHLLVGIDGSVPARQALRWATALGRESGACVHVVHAFDPVQSEKPPGILEHLTVEATARVHTWCDDELGGVEHTVSAVPGDPRQVLQSQVTSLGIDLLALSTLGATGSEPGLFRFGSVAEWMVRRAPCPMAVIPPTRRADAHLRPMRQVMVCNDGSPGGAAAQAWLEAVEFQRQHLGSVTPLHVDPASLDPDSSVADEILMRADEGGADCIVMGTRGASGSSGLRLGGVALGVVRRSRRPVVLVPCDGR